MVSVVSDTVCVCRLATDLALWEPAAVPGPVVSDTVCVCRLATDLALWEPAAVPGPGVSDTVCVCRLATDLALWEPAAVPGPGVSDTVCVCRLATDLALWEPAAPSVSTPDSGPQRPTDPLVLLTDGYQMCKSATNYGTTTSLHADHTHTVHSVVQRGHVDCMYIMSGLFNGMLKIVVLFQTGYRWRGPNRSH